MRGTKGLGLGCTRGVRGFCKGLCKGREGGGGVYREEGYGLWDREVLQGGG